MWKAIGVLCLDSDDCEVWRVDSNNQAFLCPRFVPLGWRPENGRVDLFGSIDVAQVAYVIGGLDVNKLKCLEALHALELMDTEDRQIELMERTSRFIGCRSLLWRLALVAKPHQWLKYVTRRFFASNVSEARFRIMKREVLKLLEPGFVLSGTATMKRRFKVRALQIATHCAGLLDRVLRQANERGAVLIGCMLAELRFDSDEVTRAGISRASANVLDDENIIRRMKADENLAVTWNKWYYGMGTHNHAVALQTIRDHHMAGMLVGDVPVGALMLLTDSYRIPRSREGILGAAHCLNRLFSGWMDIHCGPELKRMLGIADHTLVALFFKSLSFPVPPEYVHQCLTEPAFFAFVACNTVKTKVPQLPAHIVQLVHSFL